MRFALVWAVVFVVFLGGDMIMLPNVIGPFVEARVGAIMLAEPNLIAAAAFWLLYPAGVAHFAAIPGARSGDLLLAARQGALLGLMAYGTYELTNLATLQGWEWSMVALDMSWGAFLTGLAAAAGAAAGRKAYRG
jgi:uncharacterized membrane protein